MGKQIASPQVYSWWGGQQDSFSVYSWVFPKSVRIPGILLFLQLICMVCGCKGPGNVMNSNLQSSWNNMFVQYVDSKTNHT